MPHTHRLAPFLAAAMFAAPLYAAPAAGIRIPLCSGLTVVTAVAGHDGDYESIKSVAALDAEREHLKYSAEIPNLDPLDPGPPLRKVNLERNVLIKDLESATALQQVYLEKSETTIPETTAISTSAAVLRALKSRGESPFSISSAYSGLVLGTDRSVAPNYYSYLQRMSIKRAGGKASVKVIVNDTPVELPVVVAQGEFGGSNSEFTFLDDERNPIVLLFRIGIGEIKALNDEQRATCEKFKDTPKYAKALSGLHCNLPNGGDRDTLRVIKITYHCALPASGGTAQDALEQSLAATGKADVYSIFFSFNSDLIRDESEPTLREIAEVLRKHPDWKLRVNGHTDGIGADQANLELSKRRAAAVKSALTTRFAINADRLSTGGFGKSQPKDTNETLEGRAHNRRVELVRE